MNGMQTKIIIDALDSEHMLSEWEMEFINNMAEKDADYDVTPKQNTILNRICTKLNRIPGVRPIHRMNNQ